MLKEPVRIPTVSRVCRDETLIELVYDAAMRRTGLAVSRFGGLWNVEQEVRIETGEILVPCSPRNNLIASECVLLPSQPVEYGLREELLADIATFLHRYVDLSQVFEQIAAHYVLLTWVHDAFNELPYLRLRGEYGTGKTRGLIAIGSLCYKPFFASAASTVSPIFHTINTFGGTLVLDESDLQMSDARADLVKILNNGTMKGMPVLRSVPNRQKEYSPAAFKVFGPKLIAMRGSFDDPALESRFISEETGLRPLRPDISIQLPSELKEEALQLRNRLLHFRLCEFFKIKSDPNALVQGAEPRINQTAISLLSLVESPELRTQIGALLLDDNERLKVQQQDTIEAKVLTATRKVIAASKGLPVTVGRIAEEFNAEHREQAGTAVSNKWVGNILRRKLRLRTVRESGVYILPKAEWTKVDALAARFASAPTTTVH